VRERSRYADRVTRGSGTRAMARARARSQPSPRVERRRPPGRTTARSHRAPRRAPHPRERCPPFADPHHCSAARRACPSGGAERHSGIARPAAACGTRCPRSGRRSWPCSHASTTPRGASGRGRSSGSLQRDPTISRPSLRSLTVRRTGRVNGCWIVGRARVATPGRRTRDREPPSEGGQGAPQCGPIRPSATAIAGPGGHRRGTVRPQRRR
jgi:hypothetical protein